MWTSDRLPRTRITPNKIIEFFDKLPPVNRGGYDQSAFFFGRLNVERGQDEDITDGFGEHQHTEKGDNARRHGHGTECDNREPVTYVRIIL